MPFLDNISKKMGEAARTVGGAAKSVARKSEDMLETTKLNREISSEGNRIEKIYLELGKIAYNKFKNTGVIDEELLDGCKQIVDIENNIASIKEKIEEIKRKSEEEAHSRQDASEQPQGQEPDNAQGETAENEVKAEEQPAKKFCPDCGAKLVEITKFCPSCGAKL